MGVFVRWKRRKTKRWGGSLYAVLVENKREGGRVRQRVVKHLAHIHTAHLSSVGERARFWEQVDARLAGLGLPEEARQSIAAKLEQTVPRPSAEEIAAYRRDLDRLCELARRVFGKKV